MTKFLVLWLLASAFLAAESLSQRERDMAMSYLHATRKLFLDAIEGLSKEQWRFKPAPDRWSVAECAEHITVAEDRVFQRIAEKAMKEPAAPEKKVEVQGRDEFVLKVVPDRSRKAEAPAAVRPTGRWPERDALILQFKATRDRTIAWVEKTDGDLRSHFAPHPILGLFDAYQWMLFLAAHSERHTAQINEVKADPKFPK